MRRIAIIILYILPLIPIWRFDYLPINDYPRHLTGIKVLREYYNNSFLSENFSINLFKGLSPIPNVAFELFATKICFFCDINTAGKLFISCYVLLFVLSLYLLSREMKLEYADVLLLALPLVYSTYLYMGFLNFVFSIPIFLLAVWSYLSVRRGKIYFIILGVFSILLYLSHLFSFVAFLFFVVIDMIMAGRLFLRRRLFLTFISASIPLFFSINYMLSTSGGPAYYHSNGIFYKIGMLAFPFLYFSIGTGIAMFLIYVYALLFTFYGSTVINRVFLAAAASFFLLYLVLPFGTIEGTFVDVRAIAFCMFLLPLSVRLEGNRYKLSMFALIALLAFINITATWFSFSRFDAEMSAGQNCFEKVEVKSRLLPIAAGKVYGPSGRYFSDEPYAHLWGYAFLNNDFITPYFSSKVHHILKYKEELYTPPEEWYLMDDKGDFSPWQEVKRHYDYIAVFGDDRFIKSRISQLGETICDSGIVTLYTLDN